MDTQRRLDDILGRDIGLQWFEAVALVQAVCAQLLTLGPADVFPSAADVAVGADGSIAVLGSGGARPAVAAAGELLAGIVGDDVPVRLRLAISEASAAESPYRHLAAFSEALAYFERPDRRQLIAAVHARAATAPSRSVTVPAQTPERDRSTAAQQRQAAPRRRPLPLVPALLGGIAVVAVAGWMIFQSRHLPGAAASVVAASASEEEPAREAGRRAPRPEPHRDPMVIKARSRTAPLAPSLATTQSEIPLLVSPVSARTEVFYDTVEILASAPTDTADQSGSDTGPRVYSRDDGFVSPPRPVRPQLPPEPPFDAATAPPTELELVIAPNGFVESAKLRSVPRNIMEFMLVSAAKAWIFQPAELDGRPVRYRHRVRLILP